MHKVVKTATNDRIPYHFPKESGKGFTLIELLVVIGIIAILAGIVIIAINPARQFAQARNVQRESNAETILNAIGQNMVYNKGVAITVATCPGIGTEIPADPTPALHIGTNSGLVNLSCLTPTYIASSIPSDPDGGSSSDTEYTIQATSSRYVICAPKHAEASIIGSSAYCLTR